MAGIPFYHVDVFSPEPLAGNGLVVFPETKGFTTAVMLQLTQEFRQFESIFLEKIEGHTVRARIFTVEEELDFAGHPILGAAATLHDLREPSLEKVTWTFELNRKTVQVITTKKGNRYEGWMNQGQAEFGRVLSEAETKEVLQYIQATPKDLYPGLFPTVVSTGLSYLLVPLNNNKYKAKFGAPGMEKLLHAFGTQFIGILDVATLSIRTGNNEGTVEDIATGSLAGPSGAFLVKHGLQQPNTVIAINQGKNLGRNSQLFVEVSKRNGQEPDVHVSGSVCKIGHGFLDEDLAKHIFQG